MVMALLALGCHSANIGGMSDLNIIQHPSPNFGPRKHGRGPDMVVLHYTDMETAECAIDRLCDPRTEVSAHYVISKSGQITQLVSEDMRAWHAGAGAWRGICDMNSHSIGIELDYCAGDFAAAQIASLETLLADIFQRQNISMDNVIGHSDMAPGRKYDPGPQFPWQRLAEKHLSIWPSNVVDRAPDWAMFKSAAIMFGYRVPSNDNDGWNAVLSAFRSRFIPDQQGDLSAKDMGVILALSKAWPDVKTD